MKQPIINLLWNVLVDNDRENIDNPVYTQSEFIEILDEKNRAVFHTNEYSIEGIKNLAKDKDYLVKSFGVFSKTGNKFQVIIPIDNKKVFRSALNELILFKGRKLLNRTKLIIGAFLSFLIPLNFLAREKIVVAYKPDDGWEDKISEAINKKGSNLFFSIYASSRKINMPIFNEEGDKKGFTRIYFPGTESEFYGKNELKILKILNNFSFKNIKTPGIIKSFYLKDSFCLILESYKRLKPVVKMFPQHKSFIYELSQKTGSKKFINNSKFIDNLENKIKFIKNTSFYSEEIEIIFNKAISKLSNKEFTLSLVPREFPVYHLLKSNDYFLAIDWEHAEQESFPLFSLFSLLLSTKKERVSTYEKRYLYHVKDLFFKPADAEEEVISFCENLEISREDSYWIFVLFLIDKMFIHLHSNDERSAKQKKIVLEFLYNKEEALDSWLNK